ncbi:MAG TPA: amino acid adenylation domain-containing protein [Longimicrobiales bacterium]|nr:amino acid adenylation domain-containing protein [Longimicrobiales bacterium]
MAYLLTHYLRDSALKYPDRPAVACRDIVLTYGELDSMSDRVAAAFTDAGIGRGDRVGLCLPKSERAVVAMLGVLKAGAAYVPVDPAAPAARSAYILRDCAVRGLVTTSRKLRDFRDEMPALTAIDLIIRADGTGDEPAAHGPRRIDWADLPGDDSSTVNARCIESDPAYLLYTSGSTGNPKGVILSHRHALTFVDWSAATFQVTADDRLSNHAPHHFDLSVFDIYVALCTGACVDIVTDEVGLFPVRLAKWIDERRITTWYSVPSALVRLLLHGRLEAFEYSALRTILFAGEVFPMKYLRQVMQQFGKAEFHNLYGPTETNVCTWFHVAHDLDPDATEIPIGHGCANTDVFAIDDNGFEVRPGGTGELYVRGPALLHGYWGLTERTRQSLVPNPLQPAYVEPVYRTGDLVRMTDDGAYYFVGRRDHMVKSRGYRIELGEIEQALYQHECVREAVVLARADDEVGARLHAVVSAVAGLEVTEQELRAFCGTRLPRYMVPETVLVRDELPRTSTGKVDRVSLQKIIEAPAQEADRP